MVEREGRAPEQLWDIETAAEALGAEVRPIHDAEYGNGYALIVPERAGWPAARLDLYPEKGIVRFGSSLLTLQLTGVSAPYTQPGVVRMVAMDDSFIGMAIVQRCLAFQAGLSPLFKHGLRSIRNVPSMGGRIGLLVR